MNKTRLNIVSLLAAVALVIAGAAAASAQSISPKDLGKMNADIEMLNSYKSIPQADKIVPQKLSDSFKISADKINSLLGSNKQYGDAAATLAFADKMSGGLTDANINTVKNMKGSAGWDQVAKDLSTKVNVSDVASKLASVDDDLHKGIKQAMADSYASGRAAGGTSSGTGTSGQR